DGVAGARDRAHAVAEVKEPFDVELLDHALLAPEAAVEAHRGAPRLGRDPSHRQRPGALLREEAARGLEDGTALLVVAAGHVHSFTQSLTSRLTTATTTLS